MLSVTVGASFRGDLEFSSATFDVITVNHVVEHVHELVRISTEVDRVWVADITYVATAEGFLYLAFVLNVYSRGLVGWSMEDHLRIQLVVDALQMAVWKKKPPPRLVHHSDHRLNPPSTLRSLSGSG